MNLTCRGANLLAEALVQVGASHLFTLSGNQIMPVFDASIDTKLALFHVRHEAAAVHMADAWGRLTGEPGIAMVTAGPGFANVLSSLYVAHMAESPLVLLSGQSPLAQQGRSTFQEMAQAEMAAHVTKESWSATDASQLDIDVARAWKIAQSGRPGPVHIGLPVDLLEQMVSRKPDLSHVSKLSWPPTSDLDEDVAMHLVRELRHATQPLILAGPAMMRGSAPSLLTALAETTHLPVISSESPRGVNDPSLGAFADLLSEADLVLLLGKKLDFTLQLGGKPVFGPGCRVMQIDADSAVIDLTGRLLEDPSRLILSASADPVRAADQLVQLARQQPWTPSSWTDEVLDAISFRPWDKTAVRNDVTGGTVQVCRAVHEFLGHDKQSVLVSDGGEFGQWAQAVIQAPHRVINGPSGAIGNALPFALAARLAFPNARIVATLGDGTFGFLAMEFDTAVRYQLPLIAVVGNDATWNSEHQIQLRNYGPDRLIGCDLLPTRYDRLVKSLGGYGRHITNPAQLPAAMDDALQSGLPACLNVTVPRTAAPIIRRR